MLQHDTTTTSTADRLRVHRFTTRLAPSPTGRMHAGNIFAALVSWLIARKSGGRVLLRIDDIDQGRCRKEFAEQCIRDFEMLGLCWDGTIMYQSERMGAYHDALALLESKAHIYPCFCTRADLHAASAPHGNMTGVYPGTCRSLTDTEAGERSALLSQESRMPSLRIEVPSETVAYNDLLQGEQAYALDRDCGDFVVRRSDGGYAYHLATVVDDAEQEIDCVVRGCDLMPSTPQQVFLCTMLGLDVPTYAHLPLLLAGDGRRLAKRDADAGLDSLLDALGSPEAVLGYIAHATGLIEGNEPCSAEKLVQLANIEALVGITSIYWIAP